MQKQRRKIEQDQDIETVEDDLFELEKIITTKRKYEEELTDQIEKKTYEVEQNKKKEFRSNMKSPKLKESKSKTILKQIFGWKKYLSLYNYLYESVQIFFE